VRFRRPSGTRPATQVDLGVIPLREGQAEGEPTVVVSGPENEGAGVFSPDGRWLAYDSTDGGLGHVFSGAPDGVGSPAQHFSPVTGPRCQVHRGARVTVPLAPGHEHALPVLHGDCVLEGQPLAPGQLYYLGTARAEMTLASRDGARVLLVGGEPFPETILMWWNFVARTPEEIRAARDDWEAHRRFGDVSAYNGPRLAAPELVRLARPNPVS